MTATLTFIGNITTPYLKLEECPNNITSPGPLCQLNIFENFKQGLKGLQKGEHILILYWLGETNRKLTIQSVATGSKGVFALRSPHRPNPIGAAVLPILSIEDNKLIVEGLDCLNGTELVDIKPAIYKERREY